MGKPNIPTFPGVQQQPGVMPGAVAPKPNIPVMNQPGMLPNMQELTPMAQANGWHRNHPRWENMMQQRAAGGHPIMEMLMRRMGGGY